MKNALQLCLACLLAADVFDALEVAPDLLSPPDPEAELSDLLLCVRNFGPLFVGYGSRSPLF